MITVIALTTLVASFAISMNTEMRLARNTDYDQELEWMGRSGIELRFALANKCAQQKNIDSLNQFWAGGSSPCSNDIPQISLKDVPLGHGTISVAIEDMERKWSINLVADPRNPQMKIVLQQALSVVGVTDEGLASTIEDSVLDWCNPNNSAGFSGAKSDYYTHLNPPYYCKGGPIDDLSELLLIKGISPEIYWGSNSTNHPVSAYQQHGSGAFDQPINSRSGRFGNNDEPVYPVGLQQLFSPMGGKLNINTASALTLQLIPGMDESTAQRIVQQRAGPDGIDGTDDDMPFQNVGEINSGFQGGPMPGNVPGAPQAGLAAQGLANFIDVRSYIFKVRVDAQINNYKRTFYGIVSRAGSSAQRTQCVKFYWE